MKLLRSDKEEKNWKEFLSLEDEDRMNQIIRKISRYRGAYSHAPDVKSAQLWCTVLELSKENSKLQERVNFLEEMFESMFATMKQKNQTRIDLYKSLERF